MLRGALTVGVWTLGSRVLGFARDILIAALIGTGPTADAFFVAVKLPNLFRRLFGEGAFSAAFVPEFAGLLATEGRDHAVQFASEILNVLAVWLLLLTIVGEIFMPTLMLGLAPGFRDDPAKFALAVDLTRITFPYLLLICLTALMSGVLNGLDRFAAAAAAPLLYNAASIGSMLLLARYTPTVGHALAWGVSLSGILQLGLLGYAVRRQGVRLRVGVPRLTGAVRRNLRRMAPGLLGAGATQINQAVDVIIASLLPAGTVSVLYYAERIYQLPLGVIGVAVGTALLPAISRAVRTGGAGAAETMLNRALEFGAFLTLPAAAALLISAHPIVDALFARGAFDPAAAARSAQSLRAYSVGIPAFVALKILTPAFFARGDTGTPVRIGLIVLVANLALNLVLMGPLQHIGPPLATSIAAIGNALALGVILRRRGWLAPDAGLLYRLTRIGVATLAMMAALATLQGALFGAAPPPGGKLVALALLVLGGGAAYAAAGQTFGAFDVRQGRALLRRPV